MQNIITIVAFVTLIPAAGFILGLSAVLFFFS